jgi:hypothetical protein
VGLHVTETEATLALADELALLAAFTGCETPQDVWIRADIVITSTV